MDCKRDAQQADERAGVNRHVDPVARRDLDRPQGGDGAPVLHDRQEIERHPEELATPIEDENIARYLVETRFKIVDMNKPKPVLKPGKAPEFN